MKNFCNNGLTLLKVILVFAIIAGACSFSSAQGSVKIINTSEKHDRLVNTYSVRDADFLSRAAEICLEEISLGQLAQRKSMMEDIRDLGKMLEYVHARALKDLGALAKIKFISIPSEETYNNQNAYLNLSTKSIAEFDKAYCDAMVTSHRYAVMIFEKASRESDDLDIRKWATETLPILRTYFDHSLSCLEKCDKARG
jgi:putative membrane protein